MIPGVGIFCPQGQNLNKLGRDILGDDTPNIKTLGLVVSKMGDIYVFSI